MTSITSTPTELSTNQQSDLDNSNITTNADRQIIIEHNNTTDVVVVTSSEQHTQPTTATIVTTTTTTSTVKMKTQVLPLVYIQTPTATKVPYTPINKPNTNNVIVNSMPQFQFASLDSSNNGKQANCSLASNQSVIFTPVNNFTKSQHVVLQKPGGSVLPIVPVPVTSGAKIGAYLTMIKPVTKPSEQIASKLQMANKQSDNLILSSNSILQTNNTQKYVIAPMPKLTTNRLPATVTTNSVQPKIAFMPLSIPKSETAVAKPKFFNFKITDGQIESLCNANNKNAVATEEVIDLDSPEKKENGNKSYELSIAEETTSNNDVNVGISSVDGTMKLKLLKDTPKFSKHGVSILKKNFTERKIIERIAPTPVTINSVCTSISDVDCNADVSVIPKVEEENAVVPSESKVSKPERRRKSNFSYRKDYDDMEIVEKSSENNFVKTEDETTFGVKMETEFEQKELIEMKEKPNNNSHLQPDNELHKILKWDEGIGTLPGSKLKFIINEFNMVEYVTADEYSKIVEKKMVKAKEKVAKQDEFQQEMRCLECGCYGFPSEFISPKYCSFDCQDAGSKRPPRDLEMSKFKKKRKRPLTKPKSETQSNDTVMSSLRVEKEQQQPLSGSEEENNTSNENSQDKFSYPWACKKRGFSWVKYLDHIKAKPAPVKLFKDPFPYMRNGFRPGMKLEGVDPQHPSYFCVLTVAEVLGYRVRLHFDGYPENYDFWVNADSMDIFPMGWCEKYGHVLHPPPGYTVENFNWMQYLRHTKSTAAPKHLFVNRSGNSICPNGFRVGMKLEAVDRKNTSLVCVASVRDMMDNRILVHFDSWDDIYDYWADPTSPFIHPVGWCDQNGHNLTPPNDYPNPENFTWESYLRETKSVNAPMRAFKQRPACGFKRGMRFECVDKRVPQLIRVATVDDVKDHQIRILFDGWPDRYGYWVDEDSPDIHPVGWCQKTNHPIEPPLTPDDVYDFLECPTIGCRGLGHIRGPKYATHSNPKYCPYAEENIDAEKVLPDRLLSPDRRLDEVVPVSREPKDKISRPKASKSTKYSNKVDQIKLETSEEGESLLDDSEKKSSSYTKRIKLEHETSSEEKAIAFIEVAKLTPAERESWDKHSKFLREYVDVNSDPRAWNGIQVSEFVSTLPTCHKYKDIFRYEDIDGEAFLSLTQQDIVSILNVKVGPAVKLYNSILLLRQYVNNKFFT